MYWYCTKNIELFPSLDEFAVFMAETIFKTGLVINFSYYHAAYSPSDSKVWP